MAVSEHLRHQIHDALEEAHGPQVAAAVMELLPPVGWADIATKHDLYALEERLELRIETFAATLRAEISELRAEMHQTIGQATAAMAAQTRTLMVSMVGTMVTIAALAFAAPRLT